MNPFIQNLIKTSRQINITNFMLSKYGPSIFNASINDSLQGFTINDLEEKFADDESNSSLIFRGTTHQDEVITAAKTGKLGYAPIEKRGDGEHLNPVAWVYDNDSRLFQSYSECAHEANGYTGRSFLPNIGALWVTGLPPIHTKPAKVAILCEQMIDDYVNEYNFNKHPDENFKNLVLVKKVISGVSEITAVLGNTRKDDWRLNLMDAKEIYFMAHGFMQSQQALIAKVENEAFQPRKASLEIYLIPSMYIESATEKAQQHGFIQRGHRLPTIEDAIVIQSHGLLDEKSDQQQSTTIIDSIPLEVKNSDDLIDYINSILKHGNTHLKQQAPLGQIKNISM